MRTAGAYCPTKEPPIRKRPPYKKRLFLSFLFRSSYSLCLRAIDFQLFVLGSFLIVLFLFEKEEDRSANAHGKYCSF